MMIDINYNSLRTNIRADIVEDTGSSLSPAVDIGQIEGSYLFGLGLWTSEKIVHHPDTGKLLTDDTWVNFHFLNTMFAAKRLYFRQKHHHLIFIPLLKIVLKLILIFLNYALQNYKPPTAYDIPEVMNVKMIEGNKSLGVLSSKATGEPAVHSALSVAFALRNAVMAAKMDHKLGQDWFNLGNLNSFFYHCGTWV